MSNYDKFNPIKSKESDWWDEMCKQHGAKNHWKKEKSKDKGKKEKKEGK